MVKVREQTRDQMTGARGPAPTLTQPPRVPLPPGSSRSASRKHSSRPWLADDLPTLSFLPFSFPPDSCYVTFSFGELEDLGVPSSEWPITRDWEFQDSRRPTGLATALSTASSQSWRGASTPSPMGRVTEPSVPNAW